MIIQMTIMKLIFLHIIYCMKIVTPLFEPPMYVQVQATDIVAGTRVHIHEQCTLGFF